MKTFLARGSIFGAMLFAASCMHSKVSERNLARVPPEQLTKVNQDRIAVAKAGDEVARRDLAVESADKEVSVAKRETDVADAQIKKARDAMTKAGFDRDASAQRRASQEMTNYQNQKALSEVRVKAASAQADLARAEKRQAEAERDLAKAQLDKHEYDALAQSGDPSARQTNPNAILNKIQEADTRVQTTKAEVQRAKITADGAVTAWQRTQRELNSGRGIGGAGN